MGIINFFTSRSKNTPVNLYRIQEGSDVYCYTSNSTKIVYQGETYKPRTIKCPSVSNTGSFDKSVFQIQMFLDSDLNNLFMNYPNDTSVVVLQVQAGDTSFANVKTIFKGEIQNVQRQIENRTRNIIIACVQPFYTERTSSPVKCWQRTCTYALYSNRCGVKKSNFASNGIVTSISGNSITLSAGWNSMDFSVYTTGIVSYVDSKNNTYNLSISSINTNNMTLMGNMSGLSTGMSVKIYPGCNQTITNCANIFNNAVNFGGCPDIPINNPIDNVNYFG